MSGALLPAFGYYEVCWLMGFAHPAGCPADSRLIPRPCSITRQVTLKDAMKTLLQMMPIVRVSSPSATAGDAWTLVSRFGPGRELLQKRFNACRADLPG